MIDAQRLSFIGANKKLSIMTFLLGYKTYLIK